ERYEGEGVGVRWRSFGPSATARRAHPQHDLLITRLVWLPGLGRAASMRWWRHHPEHAGRSWLKVRRDQKYKAEPKCEEQSRLNGEGDARWRGEKGEGWPEPGQTAPQ